MIALQALAALDQRLRVVRRAQDRRVLDRRLRPARAVAVVVRREVVGDADQPRAQRAAVRLALRALEVAVGLQERLLGEVLGVVVVAHPVVRVGVDVAQVRAVQLGELAVEPAPCSLVSATHRPYSRQAARTAREARAPERPGRATSCRPRCGRRRRSARPSSAGAATSARLRQLGQQRDRVHGLGGLAEPRGDLGGGHAVGQQLAGAPVAAGRGHDSGHQVARFPPGRRTSRMRAPRARVGLDLGEHLPGRSAGQVGPDGGGGRGSGQGGRVLGRRGELDPGDVAWCAGRRSRPCPARPPAGGRARGPGSPRTSDAPCSSASAACAGPARQATARARTRSATKALGSVPSGGASPLETTSTPAREGMAPPCAPTAAGSDCAGTAKQTRSWAARRRSDARRDRDVVGQRRRPAGSARSRAAVRSCSACSAVRHPSSTSSPARASATARAVPQDPAPTTAARRSGGSPPSHSHCSITHGQMRSVTAPASAGDGLSTRGKVSGRPQRMRTRCGRMRHPRRTASVPMTATGTTGAPVSSASRPTPRRGAAQRAGANARALGEDDHAVAALEDGARGDHHLGVRGAAVDRERAERVEDPCLPAAVEQLLLGHVVEGPAHEPGDHERIEERTVVGGEQDRTVEPGCARARCARGGSRRGRTGWSTARTSQ